MKFVLGVLLLSTTVVGQTTTSTTQEVNHLGKSCQICVESGNVRVCKFHKKCPVKPDDDGSRKPKVK